MMRLILLLFVTLLFLSACSSDNTSMNVNEEMMMEGTTSITTYKGDFVSAAHPTMGMVTINPEKSILKIKDFKTDSGPLLEMYLATNINANTYISLGALKGLNGDYEYNLPTNIDLDVYKYVTVWCVEFSVNFGHAVLVKN